MSPGRCEDCHRLLGGEKSQMSFILSNSRPFSQHARPRTPASSVLLFFTLMKSCSDTVFCIEHTVRVEGWAGPEATLWVSQFGNIFVLVGVNSTIPLTAFSVVQDAGFSVDMRVGLGA